MTWDNLYWLLVVAAGWAIYLFAMNRIRKHFGRVVESAVGSGGSTLDYYVEQADGTHQSGMLEGPYEGPAPWKKDDTVTATQTIETEEDA